MYQGKFASKKGGQQAKINESLIAARNEAAAKEAAKQLAAKRAAERTGGMPPHVPANRTPAPAARPQPGAQRPQGSAQRPQNGRPVQTQAPNMTAGRPMGTGQRPAPRQQEVMQPQKRKGPRAGSVIFYTIYFLFIILFFAGTFLTLQWLNGWLSDYQAAQPTTKAEEVFNQLFQNPDWGKLYDMAGIQDTAYEGKEQFVTYMTQRAEGKTMTYEQTSAGLSDDRKYLVKLDGEKVGAFYLSGQQGKITDIPDWTFSRVELFFDREGGYKIQKLDGHTAYVNGVPLDDSFTIQIATTKAEEYLPVGVSGVKTCIQEIDGLLALPTITVQNQSGEEMPVVYDETTGIFTEQTTENTIGAEEAELVRNAAQAYGKFMVGKANRGEVGKYFDASSSAYKGIVKAELFSVSNNGVAFADEKISEYCRYTDSIFSARIQVTMNVTRKDGTVKPYEINTTLFFSKNSNDRWLAYEMTNEDVQTPVGKVRITFKDADGNTLSSDFYSTESTSIQTPVISAPEGKVFTGWVREGKDENGHKTLTVVFVPGEDGVAPVNSTLEPMTVSALFEDASAAAASEDTTASTESGSDSVG